MDCPIYSWLEDQILSPAAQLQVLSLDDCTESSARNITVQANNFFHQGLPARQLGGDVLVDAVSFPFDENINASSSNPSPNSYFLSRGDVLQNSFFQSGGDVLQNSFFQSGGDVSQNPFLQWGGDVSQNSLFQSGGDVSQNPFLQWGGDVSQDSFFQCGGDVSQNSFFHFGGEVTVDDMIVNIQGSSAPHPGGDELVESNSLPLGGNTDASSLDPWQYQFIGDFSLEDLLDQDSPEPCSADYDMHIPGESACTADNASEELQILDASIQAGSAGRRRWPVKAPSESIGVDNRREYGTWEAHIWLKDFNIERRKKPGKKPKNGMQCFVGSFASEDDAKRAHDKAAIKFDVRVSKNGTLYSLNYPEEQYAEFIAAHADWTRRDFIWKLRRESEKFSKGQCSLKGVEREKNGKYKASMSVTSEIDGKKKKTFMMIRPFETEDEAGREYDKAHLFIKGLYDPGCVTNFRPGSYTEAEIQEVGCRLSRAYPKVNFDGLKRKHSSLFA